MDILFTYSDLNSKLSAFDEFIDVPFNTGDTIEIDEVLDGARTGVSLHPVFGELYLTDYEPGRNVKTSLAYVF